MRRALLLLAAALTLTACKVDASVDVSMRPDGSGKLTLTVTADQDVVRQAPDLAADLEFDDAKAAGWTVEGPVDTDVGGLQVVLTHEFATVEEATVLLRSLNGTGGPLRNVTITRTITKSEITTVLSGALRADGGVDAFADPEVLAAIGARRTPTPSPPPASAPTMSSRSGSPPTCRAKPPTPAWEPRRTARTTR